PFAVYADFATGSTRSAVPQGATFLPLGTYFQTGWRVRGPNIDATVLGIGFERGEYGVYINPPTLGPVPAASPLTVFVQPFPFSVFFLTESGALSHVGALIQDRTLGYHDLSAEGSAPPASPESNLAAYCVLMQTNP